MKTTACKYVTEMTLNPHNLTKVLIPFVNTFCLTYVFKDIWCLGSSLEVTKQHPALAYVVERTCSMCSSRKSLPGLLRIVIFNT